MRKLNWGSVAAFCLFVFALLLVAGVKKPYFFDPTPGNALALLFIAAIVLMLQRIISIAQKEIPKKT